ncbi:MAG TPA: ComEC/Rec2 family competence protein, partial [Polyangiaceae bacterium]|nr:ComEC/Rec2 family competence protein [Polyangiaceae bacterium]
MRLDVGLVLAAAALGGQAAAVAPGPALAALAFVGVLLAAARALPRGWLALSVALFVLAGWRARVTLERFEAERVRVRDAVGAPSRCAGQGVIVQSPTQSGETPVFVADLDGLDCEGRRIAGRVRARLHGGPGELGRGDHFEFIGQLAPLQLFRNAAAHDPLPGAARRGVTLSGAALSLTVVTPGRGLGALIDRVRRHARVRIVATFAPEATGMARALVLGENDLDPEDDAAFRKSGLSHMLAVSGTHLVFAVLGVVGALGALLVRWEALAVRIEARRLACLAGIPLALGYADFAGGSGSAWRAAW